MSSDPTNNALALTEQSESLAQANSEEDDKAFRRHLLNLRRLFQENAAVMECLTAATRQEKVQGVLHFTTHLALGHGGTPLLARAIEHLLTELEQMQTANHCRYLIDESTGMAVAPLTPDMVYQTPDYVNDAGVLVRGRKVLNPGYASALGLAKQEQERTRRALARAEGDQDPVYMHLRDPDSILRAAREHLMASHIPEACGDAVEVVIEVGREQHDGVFQSPGRGFHRYAVYGQLLARKIMQAGYAACTVLNIRRREDSKQRWYEVRVLVSSPGDVLAISPTP